MFAQAASLLLDVELSSSLHPCPRSHLDGIRYLPSSVAMTGAINHNDDVLNDVINDDDNDDADDNNANDYDEHKWK